MSAVADAARTAREVLGDVPAWVVGGTLRDRLLGRPTDDLDLAVRGDAAALARALARAVRGAAFPLSEQHGAWRVTARGGGWHVDLMALAGTIEDDLARRDFTINAIAEPLAGGERLDPHGGEEDLAAGRLRMVGPAAFTDDPLRVMRAARLACELGLEVEPATEAAAARAAAGLADVSGERVFAELRHVLCAPDPLRGLELMEAMGATAVVLPELCELRGLAQSDYHHLDVHDHTVEVLRQVVELQREPGTALGEHAQAVSALLAEPLADELTRGGALRLGALLHDAAKPQTRGQRPDGRITFLGHDDQGANVARTVLERLRTSERLRAHVAALARHHLRAGFLVHERPLSRRTVHRYLRACEPVEVDVTVLSIADRLATRGRRSEAAIAAHLEVAGTLLGAALRWHTAGPPEPLLRGDELCAELGLAPGPEVGRLLAALEEAQYAGEVTTREQALVLAGSL